jgi:hypothetical protein
VVLRGRIVLFWHLRAWSSWGLRGPVPALPFDWRFFLGPVCVAKVTTNKPRRLSRQERRHLARTAAKAARRLL